ncbi:hypothetical protein [Microbacterium sp. p3-SID336]|uniref:DUF7169 domain-containing protein n=1 Tax=Microbacterium sp. p3-SID336 TaxID=2916212 RepID=UPI0021A3439E|nr:hypothetical protein [Microbacterium sp. p3-SID336]MCT1476513.1 hypothetical protein [Microbacterium sp. p3-SID336]
MIAANHTLRDLTTAHAASVLRLVDLLRASSAAQWDKSPGARMTTTLGVSDPTGELATAPSRLALRAQVLSSLAVIDAATASFDCAATALSEALEDHEDPFASLRREVAA